MKTDSGAKIVPRPEGLSDREWAEYCKSRGLTIILKGDQTPLDKDDPVRVLNRKRRRAMGARVRKNENKLG